ncbi:hypothetical protein DFH06DRAFT_1472420 [Mycena polygramma]|nr:hypothetical protein DFH06DRAFT_1472420 [Mycena polygramma]
MFVPQSTPGAETLVPAKAAQIAVSRDLAELETRKLQLSTPFAVCENNVHALALQSISSGSVVHLLANTTPTFDLATRIVADCSTYLASMGSSCNASAATDNQTLSLHTGGVNVVLFPANGTSLENDSALFQCFERTVNAAAAAQQARSRKIGIAVAVLFAFSILLNILCRRTSYDSY